MTAKKEDAPDPKRRKKTYEKPKLVIHGDIRAITKTKGGSSNDGSGKPKTKSPTGPGA